MDTLAQLRPGDRAEVGRELDDVITRIWEDAP